MKAMILCAGFGKRLKPLTHFLPKPLIPYVNKPIIYYTLDFLKLNNIDEVVINIHHLGDILKKNLGYADELGITITYSDEPEILGTAGGIKAAAKMLGSEPFLVMNGDILFTVNLNAVVRFHKEKNAVITLVTRLDEKKKYGSIDVNCNGEVVRFLDTPSSSSRRVSKTVMFTGISIVDPEIFDYIPSNEYCDISKCVYPELVKHKGLFGFYQEGYWQDMGHHLNYLSAHRDALDGIYPAGIQRDQQIKKLIAGDNFSIDEESQAGSHTSIGSNCVIRKSQIQNSVIWNNVTIKDAKLYSCIVLSDVEIIGKNIANSIIFKENGKVIFKSMKM